MRPWSPVVTPDMLAQQPYDEAEREPFAAPDEPAEPGGDHAASPFSGSYSDFTPGSCFGTGTHSFGALASFRQPQRAQTSSEPIPAGAPRQMCGEIGLSPMRHLRLRHGFRRVFLPLRARVHLRVQMRLGHAHVALLAQLGLEALLARATHLDAHPRRTLTAQQAVSSPAQGTLARHHSCPLAA